MWTGLFGELPPEVMEIPKKGAFPLIGHPAIADRGDYCSIEVFDEPEEAKEVHKKASENLSVSSLKEQIKYLDKSLEVSPVCPDCRFKFAICKTSFEKL